MGITQTTIVAIAVILILIIMAVDLYTDKPKGENLKHPPNPPDNIGDIYGKNNDV